MNIPAHENVYNFDDVSVDIENFRVQKNGQTVSLTPRAFDVLALLLKNNGRVVEKQEIFEFVWKDVFVSDNALTKIIKEIRHAFEDPADQPRYIETVPKRGYRFIGTVKNAQDQTVPENDTVSPVPRKSFRSAFSKIVLALSAAGLIAVSVFIVWMLMRQTPAKTKPVPIRTIAVLPFKPLNAGSGDEALEMGMAETLITRLSNLRELDVRPMTAVRKYTDLQQDPIAAGKEVKAETVLDGSIQKDGDRVRVTVRLMDVATGNTLWSEQFDENFTSIFKVQDSIAERISKALTLQLSRQEKEQLIKHLTEDAEAYQLYLRGQLIWNRRRENWIEESLSYYQQAVERDPNFAPAYIGMADAYIMQSGHRRISMQEAAEKARSNIVKALEIDSSLAQAHNALAELKYQYEYDWDGAEKEFKAAIELNPNIAWIHQAYGWFLMSNGRFDEAEAEMEKAKELDPSSLTINAGTGRLYYYSRQYDRAIQQTLNISAIEPDDRSLSNVLFDAYEQKQMYTDALEVFIKGHSMKPEKAEELRSVLKEAGWEGILRKRLKRVEEIEAATGATSPSSRAYLYTQLGEKDKAFFWLNKMVDEHTPAILQFKVEPTLDKLRDDPRYRELLNRIGLKP
ncbi:MAG TPA: winged helix-turn-helix domain-containing protein [Pyrinomonadaceae bacterium]|nr:winged helix-turn-helix domain-containing protein [Pyrinomonadaceae bacterium]